jgi:hypothetical protein
MSFHYLERCWHIFPEFFIDVFVGEGIGLNFFWWDIFILQGFGLNRLIWFVFLEFRFQGFRFIIYEFSTFILRYLSNLFPSFLPLTTFYFNWVLHNSYSIFTSLAKLIIPGFHDSAKLIRELGLSSCKSLLWFIHFRMEITSADEFVDLWRFVLILVAFLYQVTLLFLCIFFPTSFAARFLRAFTCG